MSNLASDNESPAAPEILEAVLRCNEGSAAAYGDDSWSSALSTAFSDLFATRVHYALVATGTAANGLALSVLAGPGECIVCHEEAHILMREEGGPAFHTGGARLHGVAGAHGRIEPDALHNALSTLTVNARERPICLSITQLTECGTVYDLETLSALAELAKAHGLRLHMDGARFANAVSALGCRPADLVTALGIDVLSFGATKNGALAADAVLVFSPDLFEALRRHQKRAGHLFSKQRFMAAQWLAYLDNDLWLKFAARANRAASRLASALASVPGLDIVHPVEANHVFLRIPRAAATALQEAGVRFHILAGEDPCLARLVTSYCSEDTALDQVAAHLARICADQPASSG